MSKSLQAAPTPDFISEHEAIFAVGATRVAFAKFIERHQIQTYAIAGGCVLKRQEFLQAVEKEITVQSERAHA